MMTPIIKSHFTDIDGTFYDDSTVKKITSSPLSFITNDRDKMFAKIDTYANSYDSHGHRAQRENIHYDEENIFFIFK
jgi:hypothetical protein